MVVAQCPALTSLTHSQYSTGIVFTRWLYAFSFVCALVRTWVRVQDEEMFYVSLLNMPSPWGLWTPTRPKIWLVCFGKYLFPQKHQFYASKKTTFLSSHRNFGISTALAALESQAKTAASPARPSLLSGAPLSATPTTHLQTNTALRTFSLGPKRARSPGTCHQTPPSRRWTGTPQTVGTWQPMGRTVSLCGRGCVAWGRMCISLEASSTLSKLRGTELDCLALRGS